MNTRVKKIFFLILCLALSSANLWAQGTTNASIAGVVHDPSGAVVPGAEVTVTQTSTGFSRTIKVAEDGHFAFPTLPVGPYQLEVKKEGFSSYRQGGIVLTVNQAAQLSVTLQVGELKEVIDVSASASQVDTTTGTLSQLVDQREIVELPLNGRNPGELVLLAPGVVNMLGNGSIPPLTLQFTYPAAGIGVSSLSGGAQAQL